MSSKYLYNAAVENDWHKVLNLLKSGVKPNYAEKDSPLTLAIKNNNEFIALKLIESGAQVDFDNSTPLKLAISLRSYIIAEKLIANGAKVNPSDKDIEGIIKKRTAIIQGFKQKLVKKEILDYGPNHPDTAYSVYGHGSEVKGSKGIVPPGCILVVKAHSGELTYNAPGHGKRYTDIFTNKDFLDPISNIKLLLKTYGSIAIYREGDYYPDFYYNLVNVTFDAKQTTGKKIEGMMSLSGLVSIPLDNSLSSENVIEDAKGFYDIKGEDFTQDFLKDLFIASAVPTPEQASQLIDKHRRKSNIELVRELTKSPIMKIKQSEIFDRVGKGLLKKGVFYNLVCRLTDETILEIEKNNYQKVIAEHVRQGQKGKIVTKAPYEIKAGIEEAVLHRKKYLKQAYSLGAKSSPRYTKKRGKWVKKGCPEGKILNPKTKRCVKIEGKIGKMLTEK